MEKANKAEPAQVYDLAAYRIGRGLALPQERDGLILHAAGTVIAVNKTAADIFGMSPEKMRGQKDTTKKFCTVESHLEIMQHIKNGAPAIYEIEFLSGKRVLTKSIVAKARGAWCRYGRFEGLSHWI